MTVKAVAKLLKARSGVLLDVSRGGTPQENALTFKDLGRDPLALPWPLPDKCVHTAVVTHVLDYLPPEHFFSWMDELHRVMRTHCIVHGSGVYGGDDSAGWVSDPQHRTRVVESTFAWLDPRTPLYQLQKQERGRELPRPWHLAGFTRVPGTLGTIGYNFSLVAVEPKDA